MIGPNSVHVANTPPPLRERLGLVIATFWAASLLEDTENEPSSLKGTSYRLLQVINNS